MSIAHLIDAARQSNLLRPLDYYLGQQFAELATAATEEQRELLALTVALTSNALANGHTCLDLSQYAGRSLWPDSAEEDMRAFIAPSLKLWREALLASGLTQADSDIGDAGPVSPCVLDDRNCFYLARYFEYERQLAGLLQQRIAHHAAFPPEQVRQALLRFFPSVAAEDRQAIAAAVACRQGFTAIVGGPGTGKTTTVAKLLGMLGELSEPPLRIALAAPTGKAAARLMESIRNAKLQLGERLSHPERIPDTAYTLHRLLKVRGDGKGFVHHAGHPLPVDLLLIDEVSMVDLAMMLRIVEALPPHARLMLLGDSEQLASVEAGSVIGDICSQRATAGVSPDMASYLRKIGLTPPYPEEEKAAPVADCVIRLEVSHRFHARSGIGRLAQAINAGDSEAALQVFRQPEFEDADWENLPPSQLQSIIQQTAANAYEPCFKADSVETALDAMNRFRILCAVKEGHGGVQEINQWVEAALQRKGLAPRYQLHYHGRPVMVTRNDYSLGLFNGDVGLIWRDPASGQLRAWFPDADGPLRSIPLYRLPAHETVYAMTIHKSQGSEFDHCVVALPETDQPVLTRELLYTGVTRAKKRISVWGPRHLLIKSIKRPTQRMSGLARRIWGELQPAGPAVDDKPDEPSGDGVQLDLW
ncbi:exodeoxyribonuclease V, alpha subunit [Hahella chejuensis KCTC 2396]|uniref:RecBCD enzyme subunit RecD n=1 Tax=Hahella chejuensis (strain KCTC 2396) TaxID=349521 RepID=Q2SQD7_HAHCH|nr:exodeoxyribonuclease V subunit alpha [Hahella chejuensis]ABC27137.1 exodeoxyribonuclease V, alpha subunit [Hahella chejuensis KCTC 2396]